MIISASRRTDISAFYGEWFIRRLRDGFVVIPNPFNPHRLTLQSLCPDQVESIIFWSKNPRPLIPLLPEIDRLGFRGRYFFLFTLNPYDQTVLEPNLPPLSERIDTFSRLADSIGRERMVWRYDPMIFSKGKLYLDGLFHQRAFSHLMKSLHAYTQKVVVSTLDRYQKNQWYFRTLKEQGKSEVIEPEPGDIDDLSKSLVDTASQYGIEVYGCSEKKEYFEIMSKNGIKPGRCIHFKDLEKICPTVKIPEALQKKDPGQRKNCGCTISKDIGVYHTCWYQCGYCYATDPRRFKFCPDPNTPSLSPRETSSSILLQP